MLPLERSLSRGFSQYRGILEIHLKKRGTVKRSGKRQLERRRVESLEIRRSSIYIQSNAKTASTMEAATHQFKLFKGAWRLVGIRIYLTDFTPDAPATTDTDMNLLTGLVVEKNQKGENKPITRRRQKKFDAFLLKDFDFSNEFGTTE